MVEKERAEPRNITLFARQWAIAELHALNYDGNVSMALRRIIDEWDTGRNVRIALSALLMACKAANTVLKDMDEALAANGEATPEDVLSAHGLLARAIVEAEQEATR